MKKTTKIIIGSIVGVIGITLTATGSSLANLFLMRAGIVLVTVGIWTISWSD